MNIPCRPTKSTLSFKATIEIDGKEYEVSVCREDIPDMGGTTDYSYQWPDGFPEGSKNETMEEIEAIDPSDILAQW